MFLAHIHLLQLLALHAVETMCYTCDDISKTVSLAPLQPYIVGKCSTENNECKLTGQNESNTNHPKSPCTC